MKIATIAVTSALLFWFSGSNPVSAAPPDQCTPPELSVDEKINALVSPITDAVSNFIFYPIPIKGGQDQSTGAIRVSETRLLESDRLSISIAGQSRIYEIDSDGLVCPGHNAVQRAATGSETAANLETAILNDFADSGISLERERNVINLLVSSDQNASFTPLASGLFVKALDNGAIGIPFIVLWLLIGAIFFTFKMRFINLRGFVQSFRIVSGKYDNPKDPGEVTHFQALTAALSGTVGLGNIAGVAIAISIGGPGATFWMILAGLFGMTSKFVECTLGVKYRKIDENGVVSGGPMYYLSRGLEKRGMGGLGRVLAVMFAILCIGGAFGAGNMFQVNQSSQQFMDVMVPALFGPDSFMSGKTWIIGLIYAGAVGLVIIGGIRSITRVTERLVPMMGILYVTSALIILAMNIGHIPSAFGAIIAGAFAPIGIAGGFVGVLVQGLRRASFSNEAGVGSAAIAHSAAKTKEPVAEGLVALLEPFIDTVVICTMTALVIIITDMHLEAEISDGIALTSAAFASVFDWFPYVLSIAVLLFAFSTSITWYYYGERSFVYLLGGNKKLPITIFKLVFLSVLVIGSSMQLTSVMDFADAMILGMALPNIIGLYILSSEVKRMLEDYLARVRSGDLPTNAERAAQQPAE
ncbi:sodium/alanine symporter AgcS [alpha proteobacterium Q-1]|nr:sodium/alanine symporter AgcS [alpha proteobacterium Q-1]